MGPLFSTLSDLIYFCDKINHFSILFSTTFILEQTNEFFIKLSLITLDTLVKYDSTSISRSLKFWNFKISLNLTSKIKACMGR
ncbi:Uncharacterised protein [Chlamydia trachomatis]|nr:Uncharacterised protein [Chlamydia trachomatis]